MLGSFRKFSSSLFAKIFLFIVAIPFVFWGMGPLFTGGNLNVIVQIGKDKIATQEFTEFLRYRATDEEMLNINSIEKFLSSFIGEKLMDKEIKDFDIKLSDNSLGSIIKNEEIFKKNNEFSRTKYEKFLVENSLSAVALEANISKNNRKEQLLEFVSGGIMPPKFLVNMNYDSANQSRYIQTINLNDIVNKKIKFSNEQINNYYNENKDDYKVISKSIKFLKLNPKILTGNEEYDSTFFEKIDEIDDLIVQGNSSASILNKFNLGSFKSIIVSELDIKKNELVDNFPTKLIKNVFEIEETEPLILIEFINEYFIIELIETKNIQKKIADQSVKKNILLNLEKKAKREFLSNIIVKISKNSFNKTDFDKLSKDENATIKNIKIKNKMDNKILKKELIKQIYDHPEKKVIVVADMGLNESYLIYIDKIENVSVKGNSTDYEKYFNISKATIVNNLYNTYDTYLRNKYEIDINYKALDSIAR